MKPITEYAERFDSLPTRQRLLIFVAAALVLALFLDRVFTAPLRAEQQRLRNQIAQAQKESATVANAIREADAKRGGNVEQELRNRQAALQQELAQLNATLSLERRRFTPPERMRSALEDMLEAHPKLALQELRTLPPVSLGEAPGGAAGVPGLFRHGMEITVAGTYVDFYEYLRTLERLPTQLYWGKAELSVTNHPQAVLKLTLYTVSFDASWLVV